jgi:uncharacterized protein (DUF2141 family)
MGLIAMTRSFNAAAMLTFAASLLVLPAAGSAAQYRQIVRNDTARCAPDAGTSVMLTITNVADGKGRLRIQAYRGTRDEWLAKGRWLNRIEVPARAGTVRVCMPLPGPGAYAIAVRHDRNGNGETDIREDGGGMSNNPSINIFNLGKPSFTKTRFTVGSGPAAMTIQMRYLG